MTQTRSIEEYEALRRERDEFAQRLKRSAENAKGAEEDLDAALEQLEALRAEAKTALALIDQIDQLIHQQDARVYMNAARTVLFREFRNGRIQYATRRDPEDVWGPPVELNEAG